MVIEELQDYWTLISAHRGGDEDAKLGLELMEHEGGKLGHLARKYLHETTDVGVLAVT